MATEKSFMEFVCDQGKPALELTYRMMMGEYIIYLDGKVIALVCDNQVFVKPTEPGREILGTVNEAPPYPGARLCFLIGEEIEDTDLLQKLFKATAQALPAPKPKKKKKKK
jgi:TfoX/Sxy family transcriptional regulator of competence genes